ncbi:IcmD (DotP) [Legionella busanensis]|uniref:IcmD (DotP) n=1 Tax=Legionella busanensis TaxID=190655 RepID=A0A378JHY6_9GAMM|nr:type IV secretion protein IcmD [Legionella busanensis]STX50637.1 IcmD (DotP) [Legionella busanensis]
MKSSAFFRKINFKRLFAWVSCISLIIVAESALAGGPTIGSMASNIVKSFASLTRLITGGSYLAGIGFSIGAIMKFKQHKDNPTQITIGTPIALVLIAAALLFLPTILDVAGYTMFGTSGGKVAGPSGSIIGSET